jgi:AraC-like DNA-binding protein
MMKRSHPVESRIHHAYHKAERGVPCFVSSGKNVSGTILVIDPGETFPLAYLRQLLPDCQIILCQHTEDACELFFRSSVDIVLLDHSPLNPSIELLVLFKASRPSVPVVVMAEQGSESLAVEVFRSGARDYFSKPLCLEDMEKTLWALLDMRHHFDGSSVGLTTSGLEKTLHYIDTNFKTQLSLSQVAEQSGMSVSSFVRFFKKNTGRTFVEHLNRVRIAEACKLLRNPKQSLLHISMICGFNNQSHFNRVFKKCVGLSPGQYKKSISG